MHAQGCILHIQTLHTHTHIRDDFWPLALTLTVPTLNPPTDTKEMARGSVCLSVPPRLCPCLDVNFYVYGFCVCLTKKIHLYFCAFDCGHVAISKKAPCVYVCVC